MDKAFIWRHSWTFFLSFVVGACIAWGLAVYITVTPQKECDARRAQVTEVCTQVCKSAKCQDNCVKLLMDNKPRGVQKTIQMVVAESGDSCIESCLGKLTPDKDVPDQKQLIKGGKK